MHYSILIFVVGSKGEGLYKYYKKDGVVFETTSLSEVDAEMAKLAQTYPLSYLKPIQELEVSNVFSSSDTLPL